MTTSIFTTDIPVWLWYYKSVNNYQQHNYILVSINSNYVATGYAQNCGHFQASNVQKE